jgi:23S rRNA (guanosine2251-2'-O)-methyltransferase
VNDQLFCAKFKQTNSYVATRMNKRIMLKTMCLYVPNRNHPVRFFAEKRADTKEYLNKVNFFRQFLQMYGRQAVRDALSHPEDIQFHAIHVHTQAKNKGIIPEILSIAQERNIPIKFHSDEKKLMILSKAKNAAMVQGVVADVKLARKDMNITVSAFINEIKDNNADNKIIGMLALDSVMTPKNIGVILRTVAASGIDACLLPAETEGQVPVTHPEVIRTSTGSAFRARIVRCERRKKMKTALCELVDELNAFVLLLMPPNKSQRDNNILDLFELKHDQMLLKEYSLVVYVIGSETDGISRDITELCCDERYGQNFKQIQIPMTSSVESLNASVVAALCCYEHHQIAKKRNNSVI